jgi:hypothetical protein
LHEAPLKLVIAVNRRRHRVVNGHELMVNLVKFGAVLVARVRSFTWRCAVMTHALKYHRQCPTHS